jgi:hypothetical protein
MLELNLLLLISIILLDMAYDDVVLFEFLVFKRTLERREEEELRDSAPQG